MPVFHAPTRCASHRERGDRALARLAEQVNALRARPVRGEDFEEMERTLRALFAEAEREVVGETLARLDVDLPFVEIEGRRHRRGAAQPRDVHECGWRGGRCIAHCTDVAGNVRWCRWSWRAGIVAGHWTALAARQASVVVAHVTAQEGERVFRELGRMRPSKSSLDRLPKALGGQWEGQRKAFEAALREGGEVPDEANDGGGVARWCDGPDEGREAGGWVCGRPGGGVWDAHVLRCRGGAARYGVLGPDAAAAQGGR